MKVTIRIPRENGEKITEKMIKDSPLSWAWQFAKELEL